MDASVSPSRRGTQDRFLNVSVAWRTAHATTNESNGLAMKTDSINGDHHKKRRWPVSSSLSVCMPFVGLLCVFVIPGDWKSYSHWQLVTGRWCSLFALGTFCSLISLGRGECWWGLGVLGLLVNLAPIMAFCLYSYGPHIL
jgi:hypothetical protein